MSGTTIFPFPRRSARWRNFALRHIFALRRGGGLRPRLRLVAALGVLLGAVLLPAGADAAGLVEGLRKYEAGDYAGAINEWQPMADRGDADALFNLGQIYRLGRGVAADIPRAVEYYRRAGEAGHAGARGVLATIYYYDHGTRQKRGRAISLWRQAAAAGDAPSQYILAILHFNGQDVPKDLMQAYAWALLAADGGLDEGRKAAQSIRPHLSPNQLVQARVLKGGLLISAPAAPPALMAEVVEEVMEAEIAASGPVAVLEPEPVAVLEPGPAPAPPAAIPDSPPPASAEPEVVGVAADAAPESLQAPLHDWSVQLGFYRDRNNAEKYWADVAPRAAELTPGITSRIVTVDAGPERGIFYRLLAGAFNDRAGADTLCDNLKASGIDCLVKRP